MERREMMKTVVAVAAGAVSGNGLAAESDHHHQHGTAAGKYGALIRASGDCLQTGEACLAHWLVVLGEGNKDLAVCAQSVNEVLAACGALMKLAGQGSRFTPAHAKLVAEVCANCEKECRKHEQKHTACKVCADSCAGCLNECRKLAA